MLCSWPVSDFPRYRYPLAEYERENAAEDARCLALAEEAVVASVPAGQPVAGIVVEPIQVQLKPPLKHLYLNDP